jgi:hypothetical protein
MRKKPLFSWLAVITLSAAVYIHTRASKVQATFHTAVTTNGVKVYANFTTNVTSCPLYLQTASGMAKTLFTVVYRVKQAYVSCY